MLHAFVWALSTPSTEMHRFRPFRNLAFYFIDFFSNLSTVRGKMSSSTNYSQGFYGKVTLPTIYEWHKFNIWQEKIHVYARKIISCWYLMSAVLQQNHRWMWVCCQRTQGQSLFRTILGTGIHLAHSALSLQLHPLLHSKPAISNLSSVNKDKETDQKIPWRRK